MVYVVFATRCLLVLVFAVSVAGKVRGRSAFASVVRATAALVPRAGRYAAPLAGTVVAAELVTVALLAVPVTARVGFGAALLLLCGFTAAIAGALRRGDTAPCRCFGASTGERPLGASHLVRNVLLVLAAATGLAGSSSTGGADPLGLAMAVVAALVLAALVVNFDSLTYLVAGPAGSTERST